MINGTLFVQIINFYAAYTILKRIILKPALTLIDKQNEYIQKIQHELVDIKYRIAAYEEQSKKIWQECAFQLAANVPIQKIECIQYGDETMKAESLEKAFIVEDEKIIIQILAQKLVHDITSDLSRGDAL